MGRRITFLVFISVFLSEEPYLNVASFNFVEIYLVSPSVYGGHIFK
jgi:hypothetical protein